MKISLSILLLTIALAAFVHAADNTANYVLPTLPGQPTPPAGPAGWVSNLYQFALLGAGLLAFGVIVYAGFMHALKAGSPSAQSDARDRITQALLGLLLLLGAYVILRTINPALVSLPTEFGLTRVRQPVGLSANTGSANQNPAPLATFQCPTGLAGEGTYADETECNKKCGGGGGGVCVTVTKSGGNYGGGGASGTYGLSNQDARQKLAASGISVNAPAPQTNLENIKQTTINEVINLKKNCGCDITVTGGTEAGHAGGAANHANGDKVDVGFNPNLNNYIATNFTPIGIRSDGAALYQAPDGSIYAKEANHWDVLVKA